MNLSKLGDKERYARQANELAKKNNEILEKQHGTHKEQLDEVRETNRKIEAQHKTLKDEFEKNKKTAFWNRIFSLLALAISLGILTVGLFNYLRPN